MRTKINPLVRTLVRQSLLTEDEWVSQIKKLADLVKPHLSHLTLKTLWDLPVVYTHDCARREPRKLSEFAEVLLGENDETQELREKQLNTQAVFPDYSMGYLNLDYNRPDNVSYPPTMDKLFWGLTRAGQWIRVCVNLSAEYGTEGINRHEKRMAVKPTCVKLWNAELDPDFFRFIRKTPQSVYREFADSVKQLIQKRREDLDKLFALDGLIQEADGLLMDIYQP